MAFRFDDEWSSSEEESESIGHEYDFEAQTHSEFKFQSGRVSVGGHDDEEESMRVNVEFERAFNEDGPLPYIFCQAEGQLGETYGDVFGVTVVGASHSGFEVNVGRGGGTKAWGQDVSLNYVAIVAVGHPMISCMQVEVGSCEGGSVEAAVNFPMPLPKGARPFLMATCVGADYPDSFSVTLKKVTRHNASFTIARLGSGEEKGQGWGQSVMLNVCYFSQGVFPCLRVDVGGSDDNHKTIEGIEWGMKLRRRPLPFVMMQHPGDADPGWGDSFIVSIGNVQRHSCQLNVMRAECDDGWGMNARAVICLIP